jgi:hypothetical protein
MECFGLIFVIVVGAIIYVASCQPQAARPPRVESDSNQADRSGLNGLFTLFLLDRWLDGGEHGMTADHCNQLDAGNDDDYYLNESGEAECDPN